MGLHLADFCVQKQSLLHKEDHLISPIFDSTDKSLANPKSMTKLNCMNSHSVCSAVFFRAPRFMAFGVAVDTALFLLQQGDPVRFLVSASTGRVLIQDNGFNIALNREVSIQVSIMGQHSDQWGGQHTGQYHGSTYKSVQ